MGGHLSTERQLGEITGQYDRVARFYKAFEPLYLIFPIARRKAVAALGLKSGDTVLEVGAGTGRNFPYLAEAVGSGGSVIAIDASAGMLREAGKLVAQRGWSNVLLQHQDAAQLEIDRDVDAVLFSLSYSAMPEPKRALARAWEHLRPGGCLAVMDAGLTRTRLRPVLDPLARLLIRLGPGNPYSRPWDDLSEYGQVAIERFMWIYYICTLVKPGDGKVAVDTL
ncbi:MAG TPA: class I SAM-dependent methyltransferase [Solirubrobacterales bacterium]|nr:class I SAM-dependent methyltransferase [Solirubrobacterales bacterium]